MCCECKFSVVGDVRLNLQKIGLCLESMKTVEELEYAISLVRATKNIVGDMLVDMIEERKKQDE